MQLAHERSRKEAAKSFAFETSRKRCSLDLRLVVVFEKISREDEDPNAGLFVPKAIINSGVGGIFALIEKAQIN